MHHQKFIPRVKALEGVSTFDLLRRLRSVVASLLLLASVSGGNSQAQQLAPLGHSTLDVLDPTFNAQISTGLFNPKDVSLITPLPDGKLLATGMFNSYNGTATGNLIRLNSNGRLDSTFNNNNVMAVPTAPAFSGISVITPVSDGKVLIGGHFSLNGETTIRSLVRLNPNGNVDSTFTYNLTATYRDVRRISVRPNGKILISGGTWDTPRGTRALIQLNPDGTIDTSFDCALTEPVLEMTLQGDKILVNQPPVPLAAPEIMRLQSDGTIDNSFTRWSVPVSRLYVQPSGKILVLHNGTPRLFRLTEEGHLDLNFHPDAGNSVSAYMQGDGKIIISTPSNNTFYRLLPDGARDTSYGTYVHVGYIAATSVQSDGKLLLGDITLTAEMSNTFRRVNPNGTLDTTFNPGGLGFQNMSPGKVGGTAVQQNNKILIGGRFDVVNNTLRKGIARLNTDGTLDDSFQISMTEPNRFVFMNEVTYLILQSDGKVIVSGVFEYIVNGDSKRDFVRLDPNGRIDPTFNLGVSIINGNDFMGSGINKAILMSDGKILVGTSRYSTTEPSVPVRLNADGSRDNSFNSTFHSEAINIHIHDLFIQPDGKIIIGGKYNSFNYNKSFVARLNHDGSVDSSFRMEEEDEKTVGSVARLADGKVLVAISQEEESGEVVRLTADGNPDPTFNAGAGANGKINALLILPSGKILAGGKFTQFNNQPRQNLALLNADGSLDATLVNINQELLCLNLDSQGRILVGGVFTAINAGGGYVGRTYVARLLTSTQIASSRTRFDFDGDRLADLAVFDSANGMWSIRSSRTSQTITTQFGQPGDITAPADFDGDTLTDVAVYRPSNGVWYLLYSSRGTATVRCGTAGDKPVPADYDGDGTADVAVWRPSNGTWHILQGSNNQVREVQFGQTGDIALHDVDFDGDKRADIAVYRPSNSTWYWLASGADNQFNALFFGQSGDIPVAADYNADGKTDIAVFRPANGVWHQRLTSINGTHTFSASQFGQSGDVPVVADYNGDGAADISVRRGAVWHLLRSTQGYTGAIFGRADEQAVAEASGQP